MLTGRISGGAGSAGRATVIRACTQLNRWSERRGRANFPGPAATSAARSSLRKPKPIVVSSGEIETYAIRPTRNFTWSLIRCSSVRGSGAATARTSAAVITR